MQQQHKVVIAIGSNIDAQTHIFKALDVLKLQFNTLTHQVQQSFMYQSKPWPNPDVGFDYLNLAIVIQTKLNPLELLHFLQKMEHDFNRERPYINAPRTLDLDIIFFDDLMIDTPELIVPHPRYHERSFVLLPLQDLGFKLNKEQQQCVDDDLTNGKIWI